MDTLPAPASPPPQMKNIWRWAVEGSTGQGVPPLLLILLAAALALRLLGIHWDQGNFFHPDERSIYMRVDCMYRLLTKAPSYHDCTADSPFQRVVAGFPTPSVFLDAAKSPLNPHWFPLGNMILYVLLAINKPALFTALARPPVKTPLAVAPAPQPAPPPAQPVPESKPLFTNLPPEPREQGEVNAVRAPRPAAPRALPQQNISVSPARAVPTVDPQLQDAYTALQQNRLETAQAAYQKFLTAEPNNVEALLGLAAIAEQQKQPDQAAQYYMKVLQTDPKNPMAQAALIGLVGRADPQASEVRLKQLLAREPSAFLYFTLGNLYAGQSQWPGAQDAYFRAHHLQSDNPDYAFNLAVSLEHLNQPKPALKFYQQALTLAGNKGQAHFDLNLAQNRINRLSSLE